MGDKVDKQISRKLKANRERRERETEGDGDIPEENKR